MKRKLLFLLGTLSAATVIAAGTLLWRDAVELWHIARFRASDQAARDATVETLVAMKSPRAAVAFVNLAREDRQGPGEAYAKRILAALDDDGFQRLQRLLRREEDDVHVLLIESAQRAGIARKRLLPLFRDSLRGSNPWLRRWAVEEIGALGLDATALAPQIQAALTDPSELVRLWAQIALWKITPDVIALPDP